MKTRKWLRLLVLPAFVVIACSGSKTNPVTPTTPTTSTTPTTPTPTPITPQIAYLVGAGDIAYCDPPPASDGGAKAEATAKLIDGMPEAMVFTAGDDAYMSGSADEFQNCYHPRWGRLRNRTHPSPGNHEYVEGLHSNGVPYFDYFSGSAGAGDRGAGFYSYKLGNWHIVALNSNIDVSASSEQVRWLDSDLLANSKSDTAKCTLAYWHHPLFTSGPSAGSNALMINVWNVLENYGVDVVVNGHDHMYERFRPQLPTGQASANLGITEYIVGTGGVPLYAFGPTAANSVFKTNQSWGVIRFTLRDVGWDSVFVEAGTGALIDMSSANLCH